MSDKKSEKKYLLKSKTHLVTSESLSESDGTVTTDDECDEPFVDCLSDPAVASTSKQMDAQSPCSSNEPNSKLRKAYEAIHYFSGAVQSSSSSSGKNSSILSSVDLGCAVEYTLDEYGNVDYVDVDFDDSIDEKHISKLMNKLRHNHYIAVSCEGDFTLSKCKGLFERDYYCEKVENYGAKICKNYPPRLIIPVTRKSSTTTSGRLDRMEFDAKRYSHLVTSSVSSRLLTRFVVPVILFDGKFICRSGSLTVRKTAVYETARQKENPKSIDVTASAVEQKVRLLASALAHFTSRGYKAFSQLFAPNSIQKLRDVDEEIMKSLNITHICDLMVEDRKRFKNAIWISSSEKINRDIYSDYAIECMPYPGCKFFKEYHVANHNPEGLVFDWTRRDVNIGLEFSVDPYSIFPNINWTNYKEWDLVNITKNYLKMLLTFLARDRGGLLVHCISGWDRTPLFISMLRVSLWADGVVHESLSYREMAYLTIAYDWYLFGHNFPERLRKKEEIMHFCFKFMAYISTDEFSIVRIFHELSPEQKDGSLPDFQPDRRVILNTFSDYVLNTYDKLITGDPS